MLLDRLVFIFQKEAAFHPTHTCFRAKMGTQESLLLISKDLVNKKLPRRKNVRTLVAVDVAKAFDSVPHWAVIRKARKAGIRGNTLNFMKAFLRRLMSLPG